MCIHQQVSLSRRGLLFSPCQESSGRMRRTTLHRLARSPPATRTFATRSMAFTQIPAQAGRPPYALFDRPIITSAADSRKYRIITLANQLQAILIHDPATDKAAAAMDVNVGHLSDPEHLQGLAHFCEHLLFLGNQKYPAENEYSEYLSKNAGHSNAYTGMDNTVYYFDVHPSALPGALDRFAQFFIAPTFTESCTEREIRAVDSENSKNLQNDQWRLFQLDKATSSPHHAYWRFGTGNLKTLVETPKALGLDIRQELLAFYGKHYSSNTMHLAVLAKEPLDELTALVVDKFSLVPNRSIRPDRFDGSPYTPAELAKLIFARMVKDTNLLEITFPMPDQAPYYDTQPLGFISFHIGHEGPGSIMSCLKKLGWVNSLSAGASGGVSGFDLFKITLDLTADGLENYQQVVQIIFAYLDLLKTTPPQEWAFRQEALLSEIRFRFKSPSPPSSYVTSLATWLRRPCPREKVISSVYLTDTYDAPLIQGHLDRLRPDNCRILLGTQTPLPGLSYDKKEQWYGTEYTIQPLPDSLRTPSLPIHSLKLPPPNSFISTNFHVERIDNPTHLPTRRPTCLSDDRFGRVWHKKDDRWWLPRASVILMLRNPITNASCLNSLKTYFISRLLKDALNEQLYEAEIAGLGYEVGSVWDGLVFNVDGYNEKLHLLMETILRGLQEMKVDRKRFQILKDEAERGWKNFVLESPYAHASYWMGSIVSEVHYSYEEKLSLLADLQAEDVERFVPEVLGRGFVESLVHGNMTADEALAIAGLPRAIFGLAPVAPAELKPVRPKLIPGGTNLVYQRALADPSNVNSAVDYMVAVGDMAETETRTKLMLLAQIVQEACFNRLRTQEQLGYIVRSFPAMAPGQAALKIVVQSERAPAFVEARIEAFLHWFLTEKLVPMPDEEFEEMKTSLANKAGEDFKNMADETSHYWMHIKAGYYGFEQRFGDAAAIKTISKPAMEAFFRARIVPGAAGRAKCSTHVVSLHVPVPAEVLQEVGAAVGGGGGPADAAFLQTKPDAPALRAFLAQHPTLKAPGQAAEAIQTLDARLAALDAHIRDVHAAVGLAHPPALSTDRVALKASLAVGTPASPAADWKAAPARVPREPKL
ncbi:hypothetical protein PtA15_11A480 [Puccinia triticina]|uniref:Insulin-degrading enzyme n=1 Tax=Puccinia triticina TaxID=208348 RepID=A0ABY7CWW1_9BASI|nr:uncharacterized protein PtA15_11A480 [Puccinia triticina]WAQ89789.1 hypothetical protein PtA15_11A480 [Puccinia triticina]